MLIIKPYGRSHAEFGPRNEIRRKIRLNSDPAKSLDIVNFTETHPELVIAQWISAIDKIATKPTGQRKPTSEQRKLRDDLGRAALAFLSEKDLLPGFHCQKEKLERLWWSKVHPYGEGTDDKKSWGAKGRWYGRFAGTMKIEDTDPAAIVRKIHEHLHQREYRMKDDLPGKREGRIVGRAKSIETSVLAPLPDGETFALPWDADDKRSYAEAGDVAERIRGKVLDLEKDGRRVTMRAVAPILYERYGALFRDADGNALKITDARLARPGLFELHAAIRDAYARVLDRRKKDGVAGILPRDMDSLFRLVESKRANRRLNALVRLGKVIHYEAAPALGADEPRNILDHWPADVSKSRYWTSDGQSEIKRNEAFVRVWRHAIALASRILTDWADPEGRITEDILGARAVQQVTGPGFDEAGYDRKLVLLFGNRASLFTRPDLGFKQKVLKSALTGVGNLRHSAFHFKGRGGFAKALSDNMASGDLDVLIAARELWQADADERADRLRTVMRGAHFEAYFDDTQNRAVFSAITRATQSHAPLPRFRRVLLRTENAWRRRDFRLRLPAPGNRVELEEPARLCQYTALKLLYERAFPSWLGKRSADDLNALIDRAIERTTKAARLINKDDHATAKAAGLAKLSDGERVDHFLDRLSAATATEFRVQRGYNSDPDNAREQSKYLDDLRCDVVAQAFEGYLGDAGFAWLLDFSAGKALPEEPLCNLDDLPKSDADGAPEDWQAVLYFLVHLVPVDDIGKLLHQLRKWTVLEGRPSQNVRAVEQVFGLYLDMHDAKFEGGAGLAGADTLRPLFETEALFAQVFPAQETTDMDEDRRVPLRGLREMLRFGNLGCLKPIFEAHRISEKDVAALSASESETERTSPVAAAQARRQALHEKWVESRRRLSDADKTAYREALATVVRHRHLAAHVTLTNHVRLHRLMMQVLGRLLDYAGLWERDLYFVTLALIHLEGKTPPDLFQSDRAKRLLTSGRIVQALRTLTGTPLNQSLEQHFGRRFLDGTGGKVRIRNDLAHFNMLRGAAGALNLTGLVDRTRTLTSYDRKLKNAVSKSVIELLKREGLTLCWGMTGHHLADAKLATRQAKHIKDDGIKENLHGAAFVAMAAALFDGVAQRCDDVQSLDQGRRDRPKKQRGKRRGGRRKHAKGHRDRPSRGGFSKSER